MRKTTIYLVVILVSIALGFGIGQLLRQQPRTTYNRHVVYDMELELRRWEVKAQLVKQMDAYIRTAAPSSNLSALVLLNECLTHNLSPMLPLVQGRKESHFGTRGLGARTNSVWNVGAYDGYTEGEISKKHKFSHPNESITPYLTLLTERYMTDRTEKDLLTNFVDADGNRYASYEYYEQDLTQMYRALCDSTQLDELYRELLSIETMINY